VEFIYIVFGVHYSSLLLWVPTGDIEAEGDLLRADGADVVHVDLLTRLPLRERPILVAEDAVLLVLRLDGQALVAHVDLARTLD